MTILKKESAYDAELILDSAVKTFGEIFGADLAVFTIINKWNKSSIGATVKVEVEYIRKIQSKNKGGRRGTGRSQRFYSTLKKRGLLEE